MHGDPVLAALQVIDAFEALGVPYLIGGSLASSIYGMPRATNDVDLVADVRPQHVDALLQALGESFGIEETAFRDAVTRQRALTLIHAELVEKVDVFLVGDDAWSRSQLARRTARPILGSAGGRAAYCASAEDTVLSKLRWYRMGREVSERQWSDAVAILRVQAGTLDEGYLDRWADELGVADLLAKARDVAEG